MVQTEDLAAADGRRRAVLRPAGWRASTWLLIGWTVTMGLWIVAEVSPLDACPYYAQTRHGCSVNLAAPVTDAATIAGWFAVWLAGVAGLLLLRRRDLGGTRVPTATTWRRSRWRVLVPASLAGVLAGAHFLLLAPMISKPMCATAVHVNHYLAYPLNCDSILFMELAHHPSLLLAHANLGHYPLARRAAVMKQLYADHVRQSRAGYVELSALAVRALGPAAASLGLDHLYGQANTAYVPLVLINLIVLVAAVALLARLLRDFSAPAAVVITLCSLLVLNDLVKAFFWSPHQQMFVLLIPLATIAAGRWFLLEPPSWLMVAVVGLGLGLAALIYANVVISLGVLVVILLARGWQGVVRAVTLGLTFAIAPESWIWACRLISGTYFDNDSANYREFVWLPDALGQGWHTLLARLELASVSSVRELVGADGVTLGLVAAFMVAAIWAGVRLTAVTERDNAVLTATGLTIAFSLLFGWGIGLVATRVMFDAFPALLVLAGWMATRFAVKSRATMLATSYGLAIVAVANALHEVLTHGPYS